MNHAPAQGLPRWPRAPAWRPLAAALLSALAFALSAITSAQAAIAEDEVRAIDDQRAEAVRLKNLGMLGQIYAADYLGVGIDGQVLDRAQLFQRIMRGDAALALSTDDIRVQVIGDTAVFLGRVTARAPTGEVTSVTRVSQVFVRRDGQWWCVASQATPVQAR